MDCSVHIGYLSALKSEGLGGEQKMKELSLAQISRDFLSKHKVYRYRMVKVSDMDDQSVIRACHWYCEEKT